MFQSKPLLFRSRTDPKRFGNLHLINRWAKGTAPKPRLPRCSCLRGIVRYFGWIRILKKAAVLKHGLDFIQVQGVARSEFVHQ